MFPTPEQERKALVALMGLGALFVAGLLSLLAVVAFVLVKVAQWVFG